MIPRYTIIGSGPSGILSILNLIKNGISPDRINWISNSYHCGSLSKFNKDILCTIPSNDWLHLFRKYPICDPDPYDFKNEYTYYGPIIDTFQSITHKLKNRIMWDIDTVDNINVNTQTGLSTIKLRNSNELLSENVILATGTRRIQSRILSRKYPSLMALNGHIKINTKNPKIGIVGFGDTGASILKQLLLNNIHDIKIAKSSDQLYLSSYISDWYKERFEDDLSMDCYSVKDVIFKKFDNNNCWDLNFFMEDRTHIIDAMGETPRRIPIYINNSYRVVHGIDYHMGFIEGQNTLIGVGGGYNISNNDSIISHNERIMNIPISH